MMALVLYSVIRRHMKGTGRYFEAGKGVEPPAVPTMGPGETLIGWYRNPAPWEDSVLIFTSEAIHAIDGADAVRIPLCDIEDYESPRSKSNLEGIRVETRDGVRFLRAAGSFGPDGKLKDAFSLLMMIGVIARSNAL